MRKTSGARKSIAVVLLAVLLASFHFPLSALADENDSGGGSDFFERKTNYDIAMVFDNSYSMFLDDPDGGTNYRFIPRWSRAKFAMEIFASMLDLEGGDTLTIFPMWKVVSDGTRPSVPDEELEKGKEKNNKAKNPNVSDEVYSEYLNYFYKHQAGPEDTISIKSRTGPEGIDQISMMYTPVAAGTPFDPVENALKYLAGLNGNGGNRVKWLIILTDGEFISYSSDPNFNKETFSIDNAIANLVQKFGAQDVKIQYLSIDMTKGNSQKPVGKEGQFFVANAEGIDIQDKLIDICNRIFDRNELDVDKYLSGKKLTLELSMRKVIVFVQGENVQIKGLKDKDGNAVGIKSDSGTRKYSDYSLGVGNASKVEPDKVVTDKSLYGQVVAFDRCKAGEYTLDIDGSVSSDKIQVFYEPDVRIKAGLYLPGSNEPLKENDDNYKGEYTLKCSIVDRETGEDVSDNPLLGNQKYTITVANGGKTYNVNNGDKITLVPDEGDNRTTIDIECAYLDGKYTIKNTDNPWSSAQGGKKVDDHTAPTPPPDDPTLRIEIKNVQKEYLFAEHDKWDAVRVNVTLDGKNLTDEQLNALEINLSSKNKETPNASLSSIKKLPGESAFEIYLYKDANGAYLGNPEEGKEKLTVKCRLPGQHEQEAPEDWHQKDPIVTKWGEGTDHEGFVPAEDDVELSFTNMPSFIKWIIRLAVAALIITIFVLFMSQKALPRKIVKTTTVFTVRGHEIGGNFTCRFDPKGKRLRIGSPPTPNPSDTCEISFSLYPVSRRWTPSRHRQIGINGISGPSTGVTSIVLTGITYTKTRENKFVGPDGNPETPVDSTSTSHNIVISTRHSSLQCIVESR